MPPLCWGVQSYMKYMVAESLVNESGDVLIADPVDMGAGPSSRQDHAGEDGISVRSPRVSALELRLGIALDRLNDTEMTWTQVPGRSRRQ
jgi:hypothetical protein